MSPDDIRTTLAKESADFIPFYTALQDHLQAQVDFLSRPATASEAVVALDQSAVALKQEVPGARAAFGRAIEGLRSQGFWGDDFDTMFLQQARSVVDQTSLKPDQKQKVRSYFERAGSPRQHIEAAVRDLEELPKAIDDQLERAKAAVSSPSATAAADNTYACSWWFYFLWLVWIGSLMFFPLIPWLILIEISAFGIWYLACA